MGNVFSGVSSGIGSTIGSTIGGLTNNIAQGLTPQNTFQANVPMTDQQNALAQALLAQSQGQGPNPAQQMLNQATNKNIQQSAGFIASQKGINPALAARQASQNQAAQSQEAAGQGALMGSEQQLAAQNQLQNLYNQQNQTALQAQGINAGTAAQNAAATQTTAGGLLNAAGSTLGLFKAHGGEIQKYDSGGQINSIDPKGSFGQSSASANIAKQILQQGGVNAYQSGEIPFGQGKSMSLAGLGGGGSQAVAGGAGDAAGMVTPTAAIQAIPTMLAAHGGNIPSHLQHFAEIYHPQAFKEAPKTQQLKSDGGNVPGKAKLKGDSYKNDTVKTMLSPGEMVIPRSVMQSKDPSEGAKQFVAEKLKEKGKSSSGIDDKGDFKMALKKAIQSRKG